MCAVLSRDFVPPCTARDMARAAAFLGPDPHSGGGTLNALPAQPRALAAPLSKAATRNPADRGICPKKRHIGTGSVALCSAKTGKLPARQPKIPALCAGTVKAYFRGMAAAEKTSFLTRIRAALPGLHPSERQLAEAILNFPGQLASYTATELAQMAGVSNATVTRFVRRIGYASFEEARQAVRAEQSAGTALFRMNRTGDTPEGRIARHLDQGHRNLADSLASLNESDLAELVATMTTARRLRMIGFRAGQPFARYLAWQTMQVHADVAALPRDGETLAESLAGIGPGDCVIVFALRRPHRQMTALIQELADSGAALALIGDLPGLQALPARWHLPCATTGAGALFDHVGVLAICGLLASALIEQGGTAGRSRLSAIERIHDALDEI